MDIQVIIADLDNTVLRSDGTVSKKTQEAFARAAARGVKTVVATGRMEPAARFAAEKMGEVTHLILQTGAKIVDVKGEIVFCSYIPDDRAQKIMRLEEEYADIFCEANFDNRSVVSAKGERIARKNPAYVRYMELIKDRYMVVDNLADYFYEQSRSVEKYFVYAESVERTKEIYARLKQIGGFEIVHPYEQGLDLMPSGVNKGTAVRFVLEKLGIREENAMVLGDSENDEKMFLPGLFKVAMGNAFPMLKACADYIAPSCDDDGVACAIEKFVLT